MRWLPVSLILAAGFVTAAFLVPTAGAATRTCPGDGTPPPGSTINGGLEITGGVDGYCELHNVTVNGGIVVDPTPDAMYAQGHLNAVNLIDSTVYGGVVVGARGEADANIDLSTFSVTPEPSTINGGLTLNHATDGFVVNATIRGGVTINGNADLSVLCNGIGIPPEFCFGNLPFCGVTIDGNVLENDINGDQAFLGDPEEQFFANANCTGNTIHGSVRMTDSNFIRFDGEPSEIEGETVTGSVILDHSNLELSGNTIGGSLLCTNGTVIHPPPAGDTVGNTVRGRDTCD